MATPAQETLLAGLWEVGMKVPALVRTVAGRVPLRTVQAWARERRLTDAGATADTATEDGSRSKRKLDSRRG